MATTHEAKEAKLETLTFQVAHVFFSGNGFSAAKTVAGDSVAGKFAAQVGYYYKAQGKWVTDGVYGPQFKIEQAETSRITDADGLGRFLLLKLKGKGVGAATLETLVEACKADDLNLEELLDRGERDTLIECVGARNAKKIDILLEAWPAIKPVADLVSPLLGYGLSEAMAQNVISLYGKSAVERVEAAPYDLIGRVAGVAFLTADRIAKKVGRIALTDPVRLRAALSFGIEEATANGDVGVRRKTLLDKTMPLVNESELQNGKRRLVQGADLAVTEVLLSSALDGMLKDTQEDPEGTYLSNLMQFPDTKGEMIVWNKRLVQAEAAIAARLAKFHAPARKDLLDKIDQIIAAKGMSLAPEQRDAVAMVLTNPVSVITGGPGCGKSFILRLILEVLDSAKQKGALTAPTGKAAKRITESTGRPASTLHFRLGISGAGPSFNESNPLTEDYLVIDEASMCDTELMSYAMRAAKDTCRVIIVGDVDQLPSVGPGQVLRDLIRSEVVPVTRLTRGFRFSGGIAAAAREINTGEVPGSSEDGKFVFVESEDPAVDILSTVKELLESGVAESDIQVLSPVRKGAAGCHALNQAMQNLLNPESPSAKKAPRLKRDGGDIRVGDRVIQTKNDRALNLVNGDVGWVNELSSALDVTLGLPDRETPVQMGVSAAQALQLAYAITVHKSQGAESPYVLVALDRSSVFMLRRSLVYTAVTRGSQKVYLFGSRNTVATAARRGEPAEGSRRTSLVEKLKAAFPKPAAKAAVTTATAPATVEEMEDVPF